MHRGQVLPFTLLERGKLPVSTRLNHLPLGRLRGYHGEHQAPALAHHVQGHHLDAVLAEVELSGGLSHLMRQDAPGPGAKRDYSKAGPSLAFC